MNKTLQSNQPSDKQTLDSVLFGQDGHALVNLKFFVDHQAEDITAEAVRMSAAMLIKDAHMGKLVASNKPRVCQLDVFPLV